MTTLETAAIALRDLREAQPGLFDRFTEVLNPGGRSIDCLLVTAPPHLSPEDLLQELPEELWGRLTVRRINQNELMVE